jgi:hypothetical protein
VLEPCLSRGGKSGDYVIRPCATEGRLIVPFLRNVVEDEYSHFVRDEPDFCSTVPPFPEFPT